MRVLLQRVTKASVSVDGQICAKIGAGLLVLLGITSDDTEQEVERLVKKITALRIFSDEAGKMNLSVQDIGGNLLIVSQFTLYGDAKKGNRPSFVAAARPEVAVPLYELFLQQASAILGKPVERGVFGADMKVELLNDGPVTIWLDSAELSK
jgi:D-aminoacyl-tRNA deacylase